MSITDEKSLRELMEGIEVTHETKEQYEKRKGYLTELVDTGEQDKGITLIIKDWQFDVWNDHHDYNQEHFRKVKKLLDEGFEALVGANKFQITERTGSGYCEKNIGCYITGLL